MESQSPLSAFADFFAFLLEPLEISCVVALVGLGLYFYSAKELKRHQELDNPAMASSNFTSEAIKGVLSGLLSVYGLLTLLFWTVVGINSILFGDVDAGDYMRFNGLFFYTWNPDVDGDVLIWLAMILASFLFTLGTAFSARSFSTIADLKFDFRSLSLISRTSMQIPTPLPPLPHPVTTIGTAPIREPVAPEERTDPVTFSELLGALDEQLKEAIQEAHDLRTQLEETKSKVTTLEVEVQEKDVLINEIEASKSSLSQRLGDRQQENQGEEKNLSLTDSVMVGDSIMGGIKIDKQINNDPDAIARAVIAAYRSGRDDSE